MSPGTAIPFQYGVPGKSLIGAATSPGSCSSSRQTSHEPVQRHRGAAAAAAAGAGSAKTCLRGLRGRRRRGRPRPACTCRSGEKGAAREAEGVRGVEDAGGLALVVLRLRAAGSPACARPAVSGARRRASARRPRSRCCSSIRSVVSSSGPTRRQSPPSIRQSNGERTNSKPMRSQTSYRSRFGGVEGVADQHPLGGHVLLDLVGVDRDVQPLLAREELFLPQPPMFGLTLMAVGASPSIQTASAGPAARAAKHAGSSAASRQARGRN